MNIKGLVKDRVFLDEDNGFHILKVQLKDKTKITVKGYSPIAIKLNDYINTSANIINIVKPTELESITAYLSSGIIKGLTKKNAKDLVNAWGEEAITILDKHPERLLKINGIGQAKLNKILESWEENKPRKQDTDTLISYGFNEVEAVKIIKRFNGKSLQILKDNPYILSKVIKEVEFKKVDAIALENGMNKKDEMRMTAAFDYFLNKGHETGNCLLELTSVSDEVSKYLEFNDFYDFTAFNFCKELIENKLIYRHDKDEVAYIQHSRIHRTEKEIARRLFNLVGKKTNHQIKNLARTNEKQIELSDEQKNAVYNCINEKVSVLTGGPGTGKTTTINEIIKQLEYLGKSILLCAPTGKAAQRMNESTGHKASTIHRLLSFNPRNMTFDVNESNPLQTDVIVIDESSMIDIFLMMNLLKAIDNNTQVIIVGDINQLVSVGEGAVLRDIIDSKLVNTSKLTKIYRQAEASKIITNAYSINKGEFDFNHKATKEEDFFFIETDSDMKTLDIIEHITKNKVNKAFGFNEKKDLQLLTSQHEGLLGTKNLNVKMQGLLNENTDYLLNQDFNYKIGDKVIQTVNNYEKGVFNGDCGVITMMNQSGVLIKFDNIEEEVEYKEKEIKELSPSYCLTIHKSQGSEYPVVIIPLGQKHNRIVDRSLLYTGITRGKSIVILVGGKETLQKGILSETSRQRNTYLKETLIEFFVDNK